MHIEKEIKKLTIVFIVVLLFTNIMIATSVKKPLFACIVTSAALLILYIFTIIMIRKFYKRVGRIREAMKGLSVQGNYIAEKTRETFGEISDNTKGESVEESKKKQSLSIVREEMLTEGEFGKLSEAINDMYTSILEAVEREKEQKLYLKDVISDMSHQLKTPIASLTLFTDILSEHAEEEGWSSRNMDILGKEQEQLERMRWLTQSLLQLARIETDVVIFKPVKLPAQVLMKETASELLLLAEQKKVSLVTVGDEAELFVDPEWMHEAISNIVKNAIEHSPEGGTVTLRCTRTPLLIKLSVNDEGRGIPEADRLKVFERFRRSSDAAATNPASIGIGLSLAKSIIEENGGRVFIESRYIDECGRGESPYTTINMIFHEKGEGKNEE